MEGGTGVGAVATSTDAIAVEGSGAVGGGGGPLADDEPFVAVLGVGGDVAADELTMLERLHGGEVVVEDLVFVVVDDDVLRIVVRGDEEAVPRLDGGETVGEDDRGVAGFTDVVESIAVVLFGGGTAAGDVGEEGFVEELDCDDDVLVGGDGVLAGNLLDDVVGEGGGVAGCPFRSTGSLAGIVETILGERCAVQINPNLQAGLTGPLNCSI